ncbi:MAG: hypothetical protein AAFV53_24770 [Myxococcota bacterium]
MARFRVIKCYWFWQRDVVVMTGDIVEGPVLPGMFIDLPRSLRGPGRVPIDTLEEIQFPTHRQLAVLIQHRELDSAPMFEPSAVEGRVLEVTAHR